MPQNVVLPGPGPWGFRVTGGIDFKQPLTISRITPGSKASLANLCPGDVILAIDGQGAENMTHAEAQNAIKDANNQLSLKIDRPETRLWSPQVEEDGKAHPFKINLEAEAQDLGYFEHKFNVRPKPFAASVTSSGCSTPTGIGGGSGRSTPSVASSISPGDLKLAARVAPNKPLEMEIPGVRIVHAQFNTPLQMYSDANILDTLQGQVSTALGDVTHLSEESEPFVQQSDVLRALQDNTDQPSGPRQSSSFRVLQDIVQEDDGNRPAGIRSVKAPVTKVGTPAGGVQKLPLCDKCGNGIVGTVVKARDKYRHPECFVCSDCNMNLKQKGYFFVEGQLYCENHARARMRPPEGCETVTIYPKA
ncbi:PDZ and LIM domain protein 3 isoform X1 [Protopterus annectens]|uniref:PDZ and LIM domain protein 3 isoform X1 n=1 Tax=Protopterus annectens TaxID=7888 RepID=UPI001CFA7A71|nr:PDZ and LIM domain protein 3 isoform X1 [Protopterus annectens]